MTLAVPVLEDLPNVRGRRVLVRADFNVPLAKDDSGATRIVDDFRIRQTLPTIQWLTERGAKVTICTHLGRPKGHYVEEFSLTPVRVRLLELAPQVTLMENLRFDPGEEQNSPEFVDRLVEGQDLYVNDAFGVSHRAHGSVVGPPERLPSAAGRLLAREIEVLSGLIDEPQRPFVAVVGGAKVADKIGVLNALAERVDTLVIGGGMSYTFLAAQGHGIGDSLFDPTRADDCRALMEKRAEVVLPTDVVALGPGGTIRRNATSVSDEDGEYRVFGCDIPDGWEGVDMGPQTRERYATVISSAKSVLWNGPVGVFEDPRFSGGTKAVAEAIAACPGFTVVGGGDSVAAIDRFGLSSSFDYISTGGGATLEFIEFGDLPGLEALRASAAHRPAEHRA